MDNEGVNPTKTDFDQDDIIYDDEIAARASKQSILNANNNVPSDTKFEEHQMKTKHKTAVNDFQAQNINMFEDDKNLEHDFEYINDHEFDEPFDQFSKVIVEENLRSNDYNDLTNEDILVTPSHHNGTLPYHLEGTIGRLSDKLLPRPGSDLNTRNHEHLTNQRQSPYFEDLVETDPIEYKFKADRDNKESEINHVDREDNNLRRHLKVNLSSGKIKGIESIIESGLNNR